VCVCVCVYVYVYIYKYIYIYIQGVPGGMCQTRENILEMVQRCPRLSTRRMTSHIGVSRMQVWRTLHEEDLYPYHD